MQTSKTDNTKLTISFGIIAAYIGLFALIEKFITRGGFLAVVVVFFYAYIGMAILFLVLFILGVATRYKRKNKGFLDDYFYFSDKTLDFFMTVL